MEAEFLVQLFFLNEISEKGGESTT